MGSYTFYVVVIAISYVALQDVSCAESEYKDSEYIESEELSASREEVRHYDCDEYQSKIWDKAFSNPAAMEFVKNTLAAVKEAGTDPVCSDTSRSFFEFVKVMGASPNAHYSIGMLMKMIAVIMREIDTSEKSSQLKETGKVISQIMENEDIQKLSLKIINRSTELLKNPETRKRLFIILKVVENVMKPSESEIMVKNGLNQVKGMANAPANIVKGAFGRVGNMFQTFK